MKKYFVFACFILGMLASGCVVIDENVYDADMSSACEPENQTHYVSWFTNRYGEKISTNIPYISVSDKNADYEVVYADIYPEFKDVRLERISNGGKNDGNYMELYVEYRFNVFFNEFSAVYYFDIVEPACIYGVFPVLEPQFELLQCLITDADDEKIGDDWYYCTLVNLILQVKQGEISFDVSKTVKVMQKKIPIEFDVSIQDYEDEQYNTSA